jgi:hypothetical protein
MTPEDQECLKLGRELIRMIGDVYSVRPAAYSRRTFRFEGGAVELFLVKSKRLADLMDAAAERGYDVTEAAAPSPSQTN